MELYVQDGGRQENFGASAVNPNDWTIFPIGWPGPEPSFGFVKSVSPKTALVHDISFGMDVEFTLDRVEVLTPQRIAQLSPTERSAFDKIVKQYRAASEGRQAA